LLPDRACMRSKSVRQGCLIIFKTKSRYLCPWNLNYNDGRDLIARIGTVRPMQARPCNQVNKSNLRNVTGLKPPWPNSNQQTGPPAGLEPLADLCISLLGLSSKGLLQYAAWTVFGSRGSQNWGFFRLIKTWKKTWKEKWNVNETVTLRQVLQQPRLRPIGAHQRLEPGCQRNCHLTQRWTFDHIKKLEILRVKEYDHWKRQQVW